jgi:ribonuclease HII
LLIAGVDEAGRGPLAGPVISAAVILDPKRPIAGLKDSKQLTAVQIAPAEVWEIDTLNILQATLLSMQRAVLQLSQQPTLVYIDGQHCPILPYPTQAIIKGDSLMQVISAASILAKVHRDQLMMQYHQHYPGYGFEHHKGYPTALHRSRLIAHGPCAIHRRSFAPVKALLQPKSLEESV